MLTLPAVALLVLSADAVPTVALPLDRYESMLRAGDPPRPRSLTVVESVKVSGSLAKGLALVVTGRSMGDLPAVTVLGATGAVHDCKADQALLARDAQGALELTPLAARYSVRCQLSPPTADQPLKLSVHRVADVSAQVTGGTVSIDPGIDGSTAVLIALPAASTPEPPESNDALPPSVVGRYLLTVLPDDVRFRWVLAAHNPNRRPVPFAVPVRANERIENVETQARHESSGSGFTVELPPGDTELTVSGAMTGTRFEPPIDGAAQFVLVDCHPLLRLDLITDAKRLSPAETGLQAQYRAAQGLLLARGQRVEWKAAVLQTLAATRYDVRNLTSRFFVAADGALLGQSDVSLVNEGAPELSLPMKGTPEFAAIEGVAVPLTHTSDRSLRLPLGHGPQAISVQHRSALSTGFGFAGGVLDLPGLGSPATYSRVELRLGREWEPLFYGFAGQRWFAVPGLGELLLTLMFGLWAMHLLVSFGLQRRRAMAFGAIIAVLAASTEATHWPVLFGLAGGSMLWVVAWLRESRVKLVAPSGLVGITVLAGLGMLLTVGAVTLVGDNIRRLFGMSADALAGDDLDGLQTKKTMRYFGGEQPHEAPVSAAQPAYRGVGAARELPVGQRTLVLAQEMADTTAPTSAAVVLISSALVHNAFTLLHIVAALLAFATRRQLLAGIRAQLERLFGSRPEVEPAAASL